MKAEYYPPNEDVILQNEGPTEMYILVTGAVVRTPPSPSSFACLCTLESECKKLLSIKC